MPEGASRLLQRQVPPPIKAPCLRFPDISSYPLYTLVSRE